MKNKKLIITLIGLITFCVLLIFGASFIHYFIPQMVPIYTTMYMVGGVGVFVFGLSFGLYMADLH